MGDKSITKVSSASAPQGTKGQNYLAAGVHLSMRLWKGKNPGEPQPVSARDYETAGFVLDGKAELQLEGQTVLLEKGDSWIVPKGSQHTYKVLEAFTAVEATSPPAEVHDRTPDQLLSPEERGITLLQRFNLSYFYPFEALDNVILAFGAWLLLRENVTRELWLGMILICCGTMLVTAT